MHPCGVHNKLFPIMQTRLWYNTYSQRNSEQLSFYSLYF